MSEELFGESASPPVKEKFDYHTIRFEILSGEGEGVSHKVECKGGDKDDCACTRSVCLMKDQIDMLGLWDVIKAAGDIELGAVSARMDWSDPEELWIEVEP